MLNASEATQLKNLLERYGVNELPASKSPAMKPTSGRTGRRAMTGSHLATKLAARTFDGSSLKYGQYLAALKKAASWLGIPTHVVAFIDHLFALTQPQDWAQGKPIVWPSNELLEDKLGKSLSGVRYTIKAAIKCGLITTEDSPNGQRYGRRDASGRIVFAFGFNLAPIGARYNEFVAAAKTQDSERAQRKQLRAKATCLDKKVQSYVEFAETFAGDGAVSHLLERSSELREQARKIKAVAQLESVIAALVEIKEEAEKIAAEFSGNQAPMGAVSGDHITTTELRSSEEDTAEINKIDSVVGIKAADEGPKNAKTAPAPSVERKRQPTEADLFGNFTVTMATVFSIAPIFREFCLSPDPSWASIVDTAHLIGRSLGIGQNVWGEACIAFGRSGAAVAIAIIVARQERGEIQSAAGFLRGLVKRHRQGELNLGATLRHLTAN